MSNVVISGNAIDEGVEETSEYERISAEEDERRMIRLKFKKRQAEIMEWKLCRETLAREVAKNETLSVEEAEDRKKRRRSVEYAVKSHLMDRELFKLMCEIPYSAPPGKTLEDPRDAEERLQRMLHAKYFPDDPTPE